MVERQAIAAGFLFLGMTAHALADQTIQRATGSVTYSNYPGLEALLFGAIDTNIGLHISFAASKSIAYGSVSAQEADGKFVAKRNGSDNAWIIADGGYRLVSSDYVLDGLFSVAPGTGENGVPTIMLKPADVPAGTSFDDVAIDSLQYQIGD